MSVRMAVMAKVKEQRVRSGREVIYGIIRQFIIRNGHTGFGKRP